MNDILNPFGKEDTLLFSTSSSAPPLPFFPFSIDEGTNINNNNNNTTSSHLTPDPINDYLNFENEGEFDSTLSNVTTTTAESTTKTIRRRKFSDLTAGNPFALGEIQFDKQNTNNPVDPNTQLTSPLFTPSEASSLTDSEPLFDFVGSSDTDNDNLPAIPTPPSSSATCSSPPSLSGFLTSDGAFADHANVSSQSLPGSLFDGIDLTSMAWLNESMVGCIDGMNLLVNGNALPDTIIHTQSPIQHTLQQPQFQQSYPHMSFTNQPMIPTPTLTPPPQQQVTPKQFQQLLSDPTMMQMILSSAENILKTQGQMNSLNEHYLSNLQFQLQMQTTPPPPPMVPFPQSGFAIFNGAANPKLFQYDNPISYLPSPEPSPFCTPMQTPLQSPAMVSNPNPSRTTSAPMVSSSPLASESEEHEEAKVVTKPTSRGKKRSSNESDAETTPKRKRRWNWQKIEKEIITTDPEYDDGFRWKCNGNRSKINTRYFRCTNASSDGCLATKSVKVLEDGSCHIRYTGKHLPGKQCCVKQ